MKLYSLKNRWRHTRGFTMIEIALCLAIVGFALVAILGVLPTGMTVQQENRDDTIILQEGNYLLEAIRGGARNIGPLQNYWDYIRITNSAQKQPIVYSRANTSLTGYQIVGLLSTPRNTWINGVLSSNSVVAKFRAMTGKASEKGQTADARDFSFSYLVYPEVIPYSAYPASMTNWHASGLSAEEVTVRSNRWLQAFMLGTNIYEVRLNLRWPVRPDGTPGNNAQVFRALVTGSMDRRGDYSHFLPSTYGY